MENKGVTSISFLEKTSIVLLLISSFVTLNERLNSVALYILLPIAFASCFLVSKKLFINKYQKYLVILYVWIAFTAIFAYNHDLAIQQLHQLVGCFVLAYIISVLSLNKTLVKWLYVVYLLLLLFVWLYAYNNMSALMGFDERMNDNKVNANYFAYYTFYATFSMYVLGEIIKNYSLRKFFRISFILMLPISFITALFTASRQILIIQLPLFVGLFYIRYIYRSNKKFYFVFIILIAALFLVPKVLNTYNGSLLSVRAETQLEDDTRYRLLGEAISVGLQNPVLGVGPGNFELFCSTGHFSHCSYTELFANNGLFAAILYIITLLSFIIFQWKIFRRTKDKMSLAFLIFGCLFFIEQFFYVFYISQWLISFFILVTSHSIIYNREIEADSIS